jgi:hypothetical protein
MHESIYHFQDTVFSIVIYLTWILYIIILLGLSENAPQYLDDLEYYAKIYVSLFLLYRFNPFRRVQFTKLDSKIAFSAGFFLLATTAIDSFVLKYLDYIRQHLQMIYHKT